MWSAKVSTLNVCGVVSEMVFMQVASQFGVVKKDPILSTSLSNPFYNVGHLEWGDRDQQVYFCIMVWWNVIFLPWWLQNQLNFLSLHIFVPILPFAPCNGPAPPIPRPSRPPWPPSCRPKISTRTPPPSSLSREHTRLRTVVLILRFSHPISPRGRIRKPSLKPRTQPRIWIFTILDPNQ